MRAKSKYLPVIIVGAGRSGTNMLRDTLVRLPGAVTWPCDEINYIWRHGNLRQPTDEFGPELVTRDVRAYVRRAFHRLVGDGVTHVVEKTCANSLRVAFVDRILPQAVYIYLVRDGRDVAYSAAARWTAPLDISYLLRKACFVPPGDLPWYATRYLTSRIHRLGSQRRLATWGPRFIGMAEVLQRHSLLEACGLQWQRCVQRSDEAFAAMDPSRVCYLRYEDFVQDPATQLVRLGSFLGISISARRAHALVADVSRKNVQTALQKLPPVEWESLSALIGETLARHQYSVAPSVRSAA